MTPRQRWTIIGGLLLATLAAAVLIDEPPAGEAEQSARPTAKDAPRAKTRAIASEAAAPAIPEPADAAQTAEPAEPADTAVPIDPFRSKTWVVVPPPPPPPKPVAPPLPFQYLGKVSDGEDVRVFLNAQGKYLIARVGDVIDGVYTVDEIAGSRMTFVYQPLKEKQVLPIGEGK